MIDFQEQAAVQAAKHGDRDAFAVLVRLYEKRVYSLALRYCGQPQDAEEAAQEAFLSAWQGLPSFRGDASFSTWLYRLTCNACMDLLRRENRFRAASLDDEDAAFQIPDPSPSPEYAAEQAELRTQIEEGLRTLSPEYRAALILREMHQLSYGEISHALNVDLGTVKSRISRGRRQLQNYLLQGGNFSAPPSSKEAGKED